MLFLYGHRNFKLSQPGQQLFFKYDGDRYTSTLKCMECEAGGKSTRSEDSQYILSIEDFPEEGAVHLPVMDYPPRDATALSQMVKDNRVM